jgi:hypothetical protein
MRQAKNNPDEDELRALIDHREHNIPSLRGDVQWVLA